MKDFAILALFFCPLISCRSIAQITRDNCGLAELMSDNRLKIDLPYNNNMNCYVELSLPEPRDFMLTIENFKVSVISSRCIKITEKVSFNIASEASYAYILSGEK